MVIALIVVGYLMIGSVVAVVGIRVFGSPGMDTDALYATVILLIWPFLLAFTPLFLLGWLVTKIALRKPT